MHDRKAMIKLYNNDCLKQLKELADNSVDSIITDPPYELGFMGKSWDNTGIANNKEMWAECLRVLKHGGHLLAFGGTRTYHRMACAIEDAGFEVRDMIEWIYSTGFPKSLNIGKAVDKRGGTTSAQSKEFAEYIKNRRTEFNITLSKADEVICGGTTNYSWFEGRPAGQRLPRKADYLKMKDLLKLDDRYDSFMEETEREFLGKYETDMGGLGGERLGVSGGSITKGTSEWEGWGTALKPAHEPICMARKPLEKRLNIAQNCLKWGTGGINIDASRVESDFSNDANLRLNAKNHKRTIAEGVTFMKESKIKDGGHYLENQDLGLHNSAGRFPANLILGADENGVHEEVKACFPETKSGGGNKATKTAETFLGTGFGGTNNSIWKCDSGNASRFFKSIIYQAKASKSDRNEGCGGMEEKITNDGREKDIDNAFQRGTTLRNNSHPTVKPTALMQYLIKMITPKGGIVLDPFMGSGSTGKACIKDGFSFIGIEKEEEYFKIAEARIKEDKQLKF